MSLVCAQNFSPIINVWRRKKKQNFHKSNIRRRKHSTIKLIWNIYLQYRRLHNKWKAISSNRYVRVPNVISTISTSCKNDAEMLNVSLSHRTLSIGPIAPRRPLHLYYVSFRPFKKDIIFFISLSTRLSPIVFSKPAEKCCTLNLCEKSFRINNPLLVSQSIRIYTWKNQSLK